MFVCVCVSCTIVLPPQHGINRVRVLHLNSTGDTRLLARGSASFVCADVGSAVRLYLQSQDETFVFIIEKMANDSPAKSLVDIDLSSLRVGIRVHTRHT